MAEWNLAVRLTGQGSDLSRTLRNLSRDANAASRNVKALRRDIQQLRRDSQAPIRVRLSVDARRLRSDVRTALSAAGSGQGIKVRLNVDAARLRADVSTALTAAGSGQRLGVRLGVDARRLRADVAAALSAAGAGQDLSVRLNVNAARLRADAQAAVRAASGGLDLNVGMRISDRGLTRMRASVRDTAHSLNTLQRAAREAKNELEELEGRAVTTAAAIRRISTAATRARGRLDDMSTGTRTFRTDLDDLDGSLTRVTGRLGDLRGRVGGLTGSSSSGNGLSIGLGTLIPIATAAVPLLAGLSTSLAPLSGAFAAASVPAAAFGIALAGQIGPLTEVTEAETKYQDAVREHGAASEEAIKAQVAYQKLLAEMPPETQKAAISFARLKTTFTDWSDEVSGFTMQPLTKGMTVLEQLVPRLTPHVQTASTQLDRLVTIAGGAVETPGFDRMADRFAEFTDRQLDDMTDGVIHFLRVLSEGGAFQDGPIAEFMAYARENGPAAREALRAISDAVVTLMQAAAEAGPTMLTLVTAAAKLVAALPPELVGIILQVATALKLLQLSGAGMAALAAGVGRVRTAIGALGTTAATAGGGLAGLRAAFLSLGLAARASIVVAGIGLLVYALAELSQMGRQTPPDVEKLTTSLQKLGATGKVTGEAARVFGKDLDGLYDKVRSLTDPSATDDVQQWIVTLGGLADWDSTPVKEAKENIDAIDKSLAGLVKNGQADLAAEALKRLTAEYGKGGRDTSQFTKQLDDYQSAIADAAFEQELAAASMGLFGKAAQDTQAKLEAQKASADGLRQSIIALNDVNRAAGSAMSAFEQSIDDATEAVEDHGSALKMRDGELDLGSEKAREAEKVLSELAANTDAAATAAREQGKSWEYVSGIQERGREAFIDAAAAMGLTEKQAKALADSYLGIPDEKSTRVEMRTEDAIAGLDAVIAAIEETPNKKSVTVDALTSDAVNLLEGLGYKVTELKDGRFKVTAETGTASRSLDELKGRRDGLADKTITIDAATAAAIRDLEKVKEKVAGTKGKTIEMKAPTAAARKQLELLGFKIRDTKGKNVVISVPTGTQRANVSSLAAAISSLRDKSVKITTTFYENRIVSSTGEARSRKKLSPGSYADGAVVDYYADGGIRGGRVSFFASGGTEPGDRPDQHVAQIAPAGSYRVWGERETQGEGYVPFRRSARPRSRAITEEIVRRLGGDPAAIQWNADGSLSNWQYDPVSGSLYSPSDAGAAGHKTRKVKTKGGKVKEIKYYDLAAVEKKLISLGKATVVWNRNLEKVADRAGGDVAKALASMGNEGVALAAKMAKGTDKYVAQMSLALRRMMQEARASLTDFTLQLNNATGSNAVFQNNLAKLAAMGYGDLASHLAAKGDQASMELAADAASSRSKAARANTAVKKAKAQLSSEEMETLIQIIAAITSKTVGIHQVADKTGIGEDVIIEVANKAKAQISKSLGAKAAKFLADLGKANKQQAYADGGIRAGLYATQGGIIRFAEPSTRGEAYIPLGANKRRTAMPVLADVASRFGVGLTDGQSGRVVIIREGPLIGASHFHIGDRKSDRDLARAIEQRQAYQLRRMRRGGVGARG
ncbi:hypothetical protein OOK48_34985 [Streptomyces viridodiastaticus]|uniref:hypothetical protein n=1 Tax=Streptomyces albogriseolus TaxID=1887 RepID=UPI00224EA08F|nr:hypothetical protein [Streptomyces viridodiastaticus]MCX4571527.1 hypothetical protein [Streptomyces viridodiastaticus]